MLAQLNSATTATAIGRPSGLKTETVRTSDGLAKLRPEWNDLLSASRSDCIFLTWEWLNTWWSHLSGSRKLAIAIVRAGDELQALAPLAVKWPKAEFCGSGYVGSDYLDFIVREGWEDEARSAFASHLNSGPAMKLANLRRGENFVAGLASSLEANGWRVSETKTNVCPYIPISGGWDSYLATLGSEHRYNLNRRLRQLHREFDVRFESAQTPEQVRQFTDVLIAQHNLRRQGLGGSDAFHTPELVAFHREFTQTALKLGWLRLFVLLLNGRPAASLYGFLYNRVFYFYQSGFDPAFQKYSVGLVVMGLAIKTAIEEGAGEFDFLHGGEDYKSRWTSQSRELGRLELYPPGPVGDAHCMTVALARRLKGFLG